MVTLNDYLYSGHTVLRIIKRYMEDLRTSAVENHNEIDLVHCNYLLQIMEILEHNDFLTAQSQKIREFYKYMAQEYSYLSFTLFYEKKQENSRGRMIPKGECPIFDEAYERCTLLQKLELSEVDVNMFAAINNDLVNDGC